jgi:putative FmdB family regulatory protein
MPVYDYQCTDCNSKYDVFHKGQEVKEDVVCPSCGSFRHKKMMSLSMVSMGTASSVFEYSRTLSCEAGGCCGGGACGLHE